MSLAVIRNRKYQREAAERLKELRTLFLAIAYRRRVLLTANCPDGYAMLCNGNRVMRQTWAMFEREGWVERLEPGKWRVNREAV